MDYFILTETSLFRLIRGEKKISPDAAYQDFVVQVIELCKHSDDGYKAVARPVPRQNSSSSVVSQRI